MHNFSRNQNRALEECSHIPPNGGPALRRPRPFAEAALRWAVDDIGWGFAPAATGFVVFVDWLALSRYGDVPLGGDGERPESHTLSWIAMMFIAGMGIGLMFFGVAEPLAHYVRPAGHVRTDERSRRAGAAGDVVVPLGVAPVGDLLRGRADDRLRHLPPGAEPADQLRVRPAAGRTTSGQAGGQVDRRPRAVRDAVRFGGVAGHRHPVAAAGVGIDLAAFAVHCGAT